MTDNRTTELLPCGHCGSNVELYEFEYPNGEHAYRLMSVLGGCMVCGNIESIEPTALDAFIAAWNTRTPEQAIAATVGSGTCEIALARLVDVAAKADIDSCAEILECVEAIRKAVKR